MSVWEGLEIQEVATGLLRRDVESGRVSHAYLFSGAAGTVPVRAAQAFAAALVCEAGGCGRCRRCRAVSAGVHPDVEVIEPPGMQLLVEQVREVVRAAWRMPTDGQRRVVIVHRADRMNPNAQNAFLKALEEPPASTTIILVAPSVDALLETVRSRCRDIPFRTPSEGEVAQILSEAGIALEEATAWVRAGGNLDRAASLATDADARRRREEVLELALRLTRDPGEAMEGAETVAGRTRELRESIAEAHKETAAEHEDWFRETRKAADDRLRREQRRAEQDALLAALDDVGSVLRDLLVISADPDAPLLNEPLRQQLAERSALLGARAPAAAVASLGAVELARRRLAANANVLLALEGVFLALHDHLTPGFR